MSTYATACSEMPSMAADSKSKPHMTSSIKSKKPTEKTSSTPTKRPYPKNRAKAFNLNQKIISKLRDLSRIWPPANEVLRDAREGKDPYGRDVFRCKHCEKLYVRALVQRDHIVPVGGYQGCWNTVIERMFVPKSGYQILCLQCHRTKTNWQLHGKKP